MPASKERPPLGPGCDHCHQIGAILVIDSHERAHEETCPVCGPKPSDPAPPDDFARLLEGNDCPRCQPDDPSWAVLVPTFAADDPRQGVTCPNCGWSQRHNAVRGSGALVIEIGRQTRAARGEAGDGDD